MRSLATQKLISLTSSLRSVTVLISVNSNSEEEENNKLLLSSKSNLVES